MCTVVIKTLILLKFPQRKLDIFGNYIITEASSLYNCVNLSYSACNKKHLKLPVWSEKFEWTVI